MSAFVHALRAGRGLSRYAAFVLAFMVLVIIEGAVVRATGSGAGCGNHWPLCNGEVIPHHPRLATIIEFAHRSLTGVLTTLCALLLVWVFHSRANGDRVRKAAVWVGILLVTEALLGAVLVKGGYVERNASNARVVVQGVHFTNTLLLVAALTLVWWWARTRTAVTATRDVTAAVWLSLAATMIVGATGSVAALADTLFPAASLRAGIAQDFSSAAPLLVRMRWVHPAGAALSVFCVGWLCFHARGKVAVWVAALMAMQFVLGTGDVLLLAPTWMQVLHLFGADLYWIASIAFAAAILESDAPVSPQPRQLTV